jgi:hypothetical protein
MNLEKEIQKIKSYKTWTIKRKVDTLLEIDADAYTRLGVDSTKKEREITRKNSRKIYRVISEISPLDGYMLEAHMKEKDLRDVKVSK